MHLALLWCCTNPISSLPGPPTTFFKLHIHEIFYILTLFSPPSKASLSQVCHCKFLPVLQDHRVRYRRKEGRGHCSPIRMDCRLSFLATPSLSLLSSPVMMRGGGVIVVSDYLLLAGWNRQNKVKLWSATWSCAAVNCVHGEARLNLNTPSLTAPHISGNDHDPLGHNRRNHLPSAFSASLPGICATHRPAI